LKLFLITGGLLIACTLIIFVLFYFMLPGFYYKVKIQTLNGALEQLTAKAKTVTLQEAKPDLDAFTQRYNVWIGIKDDDERFVYFPSGLVEQDDAAALESRDKVVPVRRIKLAEPVENMHFVDQPISFRDGRYTLHMNATLQPIDEASKAILMFAPYVVMLILLVSAAGAIVYSRLVARPLLNINRVAKSMADLDFGKVSDIRSDDEIGELSRSLNRLSANLRDTMTELRQANDQLSVEIHKQREMEEQRKQFIATVSHELKTPITAVMGQLEGMIHGIGAYRDRDKYLNRSYAVMQDMEQLVQELLDLSKLENAAFQPRRERVDWSAVVRDSLRRLEYASGAKRIVVAADVADSVYVTADRDLLQKAVTNVIHNAIQYTGEGEQVQVRLERTGDSAVLHVLNTGAHIAEEQLADLFSPFHRVEKSRNRNTGGSGLGLYIVKQIMEVHGARYSIGNTDRGVLFTIAFESEAS